MIWETLKKEKKNKSNKQKKNGMIGFVECKKQSISTLRLFIMGKVRLDTWTHLTPWTYNAFQKQKKLNIDLR